VAGGTSTNVSLRIDEAGVPTVIKHGAGPEEARRRRHEAEVLTQLEGAPVVELRAVVDRGDDVELELEHVPARSLDACPPMELDELAALALGLAKATDELHRRGVVHLAIEPSHVLVPEAGAPVLCGLADAAVAAPGETLDPTADDRALRRLLEQEVARSAAARVIDPADPRARQLEHIVSPARQPPPATPAALTEALQAFTSAASPSPAAEVQPTPIVRGTRRRVPWLGIAGGIVAIAVLVAAWWAREDPDASTSTAAATSTTATPAGDAAASGAASTTASGSATTADDATTTTGRATTTTGGVTTTVTTQRAARTTTTAATGPTTTAAGPAACPRLRAGLGSADVDGDGCPESYRLLAGRIEVGGRAYGIGEEDDLLAVGDWDCDGTATPALVRPATGSVFLFAAWPAADSALSAEPVTTVADPQSVATASDATGCDILVVETPSGAVTVADPARARS
jgi:hypothetical protein